MGAITKNFTATGITDAVLWKEGVMSLSGTFEATAQIEVDVSGSGQHWAPAVNLDGSIIELNGPGTVLIETGVRTWVRARCSAHTSGTMTVELAT